MDVAVDVCDMIIDCLQLCKNIEFSDSNTKHIKFISYSGKYPCLCCGILVLEIDGKQVSFGDKSAGKKNVIYDYDSFWNSGGWHLDSKDNLVKREWIVNYGLLPKQYRKYIYEIDKVLNENVEFGCCGGCIE